MQIDKTAKESSKCTKICESNTKKIGLRLFFTRAPSHASRSSAWQSNAASSGKSLRRLRVPLSMWCLEGGTVPLSNCLTGFRAETFSRVLGENRLFSTFDTFKVKDSSSISKCVYCHFIVCKRQWLGNCLSLQKCSLK